MEVATLRSWSAVDALEPEWNKLLTSSSADSIFLTWEWVCAWRENLREEYNPYVVTVRDSNGELRGVAPLYESQMRFLKLLPIKVLRPLGDIFSGAEYPAWIACKDEEGSVLGEIAAHLASCHAEWDLMWMPKVRPGASDSLRTACENTSLTFVERNAPFSDFKLPESLLDFEQRFSRNTRNRMRRTTRRVLKSGEAEFVCCNRSDQLPVFLNALFSLHQARWEVLGTDGLFVRAPKERDFYSLFSPVALENDWLRLYALKSDDAFIAVQIGYEYGGVFLQMQEGFDPEMDSGAGNALRHLVIGDLIDRGVKSYDFLGGWSEHKQRWGAVRENGSNVMVGSGSLVSKLLFWGPFWPTGRFIHN